MGLANRRQGLAAVTQALARFRRRGGDAVLMIVDIDRFKELYRAKEAGRDRFVAAPRVEVAPRCEGDALQAKAA